MSFGEGLRRERELRGIELREIADATKISVRFLQALEQDRPEILPGGMFPQAFVRQYARYVGLDPDKAVAEYLYSHRGAVPDKTPRPMGPPSSSPRGLWVAIALAVAVLGMLSLRGRRPEPVPPPTSTVAPPLSFPADRVYPPPVPGQAAAAVASNPDVLSVKLSARETSWLMVQADHVTVLNRTLSQGETQTIDAKSEVVLTVGNAGGVAVEVNSRALAPLGAAGEVKRNILISRDTLPAMMGEASPRPAPSARPSSTPPAAPPQPSPSAVAPSPAPSPAG